MSPKEIILLSLSPHICTDYSCGQDRRPSNHIGCMELSSDVFIEATQATSKRENGEPMAPD